MKAALIALAGIFSLFVSLLWLDMSRRFARILFADYVDTAKMQATLANGRISDPEMYYLEMLGPTPRMWRVAMWRASLFVFDFALAPVGGIVGAWFAVAQRSALVGALAACVGLFGVSRIVAHVQRRRENINAARTSARAMFGDSYDAAPSAERLRMESLAQTSFGQFVARKHTEERERRDGS